MLKLNALVLFVVVFSIGLAFALQAIEETYGTGWAITTIVVSLILFLNIAYLVIERIYE